MQAALSISRFACTTPGHVPSFFPHLGVGHQQQQTFPLSNLPLFNNNYYYRIVINPLSTWHIPLCSAFLLSCDGRYSETVSSSALPKSPALQPESPSESASQRHPHNYFAFANNSTKRHYPFYTRKISCSAGMRRTWKALCPKELPPLGQ